MYGAVGHALTLSLLPAYDRAWPSAEAIVVRHVDEESTWQLEALSYPAVVCRQPDHVQSPPQPFQSEQV